MTQEERIKQLEDENAKLKEQVKFNYCDELGKQFQDLCTDKLLNIGINLNCYSSKKYQLNKGESASLLEIKHDSKWQQTGNLYFEVEALNKAQTEMVGGGIKKEDKSWLYLIGDETKAFIFSKFQLQRLYEKVCANEDKWKKSYGITIRQHVDKDTGKATSSGMCIPVSKLDVIGICVKTITF